MGLGGRRFARRRGLARLFRRPPSVRPGGEAAGVTVVDDYAHHPRKSPRRSRPRRLFRSIVSWSCSASSLHSHANAREEFAHAFDRADALMVMDVYSAGEDPIEGVSGQTIVGLRQRFGRCWKGRIRAFEKTKRSKPSSTRFVRAICSLRWGRAISPRSALGWMRALEQR